MTKSETPKPSPAPPSNPGPYVNYLTRRETHTSRAVLSVFVALLIIAAVAYIVTEAAMSMLNYKPLLIKPSGMAEYVATLGTSMDRLIPASVIAVGVVIALVGLFLILKAILPGALRRHVMKDERMAVVVDDAVIAAGISRAVRRNMRLDSGQVTTSVQRHYITPNITPTSGRPIEAKEVEKHVGQVIQNWHLQPAPKIRANINSEGVVGR